MPQLLLYIRFLHGARAAAIDHTVYYFSAGAVQYLLPAHRFIQTFMSYEGDYLKLGGNLNTNMEASQNLSIMFHQPITR